MLVLSKAGSARCCRRVAVELVGDDDVVVSVEEVVAKGDGADQILVVEVERRTVTYLR